MDIVTVFCDKSRGLIMGLIMDKKKNALGSRIKALRDEKNWSQEILSQKAKIARSVITMIETGQRYPSEKTLNKIIEALDSSLEELYTNEVREQAIEQLKLASKDFAKSATTNDIIKVYRKMVKND